MPADIHHKIGFTIFPLDVVVDLLRSPSVLRLVVNSRFYFSQSAKETSVAYQFASFGMVNMAVINSVAKHNVGLVFSNDFYDRQLRFFVIDKKPIGKP